MSLKKLLPNILLLCVSFLFMTVVIETALQLINPEKPVLLEKPKSDWALVPERVWTEHDAELGWALQKNKDALLKIEHGSFNMRFNAQGIRASREYSVERQPGVKRIVTIGDSFPFGWGVKDDEIFTRLLELRNDNLEVINLSVPGYGIDQIYLTYEVTGKKFNPDIVLIGIYPEDFWRATRAFADTGHAKPYFKLGKNGKLQLLNTPVPQPFTLTTNQFPEIREMSPFEKLLSKTYTYRFFKKRFFKLGKSMGLVDPNTSDEWVLGKAILKSLLASIQSTGATPLIFTAPPERWAKDTSDDSLLDSIQRFANETKVLFLDFTPEFRKLVAESNSADYYIPGDLHWTAKAHTYVSHRLAEYLTQNGYPLK